MPKGITGSRPNCLLHPDRPALAKNLCPSCYNRQHRGTLYPPTTNVDPDLDSNLATTPPKPHAMVPLVNTLHDRLTKAVATYKDIKANLVLAQGLADQARLLTSQTGHHLNRLIGDMNDITKDLHDLQANPTKTAA